MSLDGHLDVDVGPDAVEFAFAVTNASGAPVELTFRDAREADVAVYADGVEVWRWSDGRFFAQAMRTERLPPGETLAYQRTWDGPPPGRYVAQASLVASNVTLDERVAFEV